MANGCACVHTRKSCTACVTKKVENFKRSVFVFNFFCGKIPVNCLFGEHTRVLESHRLDVENEVAVIYSPAVGNFFVLLPTSSATI